jgi:hypothetical protein
VRAVRTTLAVLLCACGPTSVIPMANPARPEVNCSSPPVGRRSLVTRLELERGTGAIAVDGTSQSGCAIWDLPAGTHHVTLTAAGEGGFGVHAKMQVTDPPMAYDLFDLSCGLPGSCDTGSLRGWEASVVADRAKMSDPCAAAKLTGIKWDTEQLDDVHPKKLVVSFDLHVYNQPSGKPPHDPSCPDK